MYGFAVGGQGPFNAETELLSLADWTWSSRAKYPFANSISLHATAMHNDVFYVFGGYDYLSEESRDLATIAQYNPDSDTWTQIGELNTARRQHDVIVSQGAFLVIGYGSAENCQLKGNSMTCMSQEPYISRNV